MGISRRFISLAMVLAASSAFADEASLVLSKDNTVALHDSFNYGSMATLQTAVMEKHQSRDLAKDKPLYLVIDSGGGQVSAGLEAIDNLTSLGREIKTVTIFSASMGFQLVQSLGERLVLPNGTLMSHRARGGFYGEFPGNLVTRLDLWLKKILRLDTQAAKRMNVSVEKYRATIADEFWCDGVDCVASKAADRVVTPTCDSSLSGVSSFREEWSFWGMSIIERWEKANCPLITGYLNYTMEIQGDTDDRYSSQLNNLARFRQGRMSPNEKVEFIREIESGGGKQ